MPTEKTILLYQFGELSDAAKETAREWYRGGIDADDIANDMDDVETIAGILGVEFRSRSVKHYGGGTRSEPVIYWSLDPSECAFEGTYSFAKQAGKKIRQHAPQDAALHRIADKLADVQRRNFYQVTGSIETTGRGDSMMIRLDREDGKPVSHDDDWAIVDALEDFARWIVKGIDENRDWLFSAEQVDDSIRANEYTFDEDGNRRD